MSDQQARIKQLEDALKELVRAIGRAGPETGLKIPALKAWRTATGDTLLLSKTYFESLSGNQSVTSSLDMIREQIASVTRRIEALEQLGEGNGT